MKNQKIGWIGLGNMGVPMASNLIKAGFDVGVHNRTADKMRPLADIGATTYTSIEELRHSADVVFTMLPDDTVISSVYRTIMEGDVTGKLCVNMSTISASLALSLAEELKSKGASYLDAPVAGSKKPATDATLIILVGGSQLDYNRAFPYFEKMGKLSLLLGGVGQGTKAKLAMNYYVSIVIEGLAESVMFAESHGIAKAQMLEIINEGACGCGMTRMKTPSILADNYPTAFSMNYMLKDVKLARADGLNSDVSKAIEEAYQRGVNAGHGEQDLMAVIRTMQGGKR